MSKSKKFIRMRKLESFEERWKNCKRCSLHTGRSKVVNWRGSPWSKLFLIGEAPGEEEDKNGFPFVGRSGRKLDELLIKAGLDITEDIFITNTVGCRPPNNRNPYHLEMKFCLPRLEELLKIVKPKSILFIGRVPSSRYAGVTSIKLWRNTKIEVNFVLDDKIKTFSSVVTYHPSYLIRNGNNKEIRDKIIDDIKLAMEFANE